MKVNELKLESLLNVMELNVQIRVYDCIYVDDQEYALQLQDYIWTDYADRYVHRVEVYEDGLPGMNIYVSKEPAYVNVDEDEEDD